MLTLGGTGVCIVRFGQCQNALVTWGDKTDKLQHYEVNDEDSMELVWEKSLPEGVNWKEAMWTTPSRQILISPEGRLLMFTSNLMKISEFKLPGDIAGLTTGQRLVVGDEHTAASKKDGLMRLDVRTAASPETVLWRLRTPASQAYKRSDLVFACGSTDGAVAVIDINKPFVDFYEPGGMCSIISYVLTKYPFYAYA